MSANPKIYSMISALAFALCLLGWTPASAQDLAVTNARIIDGTGAVIERGSIVVEDGRIVSVSEGMPDAAAAQEIDAKGMTVMPGLIDTHRHLLGYTEVTHATDTAELREYIQTELPDVLDGLLRKGVTTIMSPGDFVPEIFEIKDRLAEGDLTGPRLIAAAGPIFTAPGDHPAGSHVCRLNPSFCQGRLAIEVDDPDTAREKVRQVGRMGADMIKVILDQVIIPESTISDAVLKAMADEAERLDLPLIVHVTEAELMVKTVRFGADKLVHMPVEGSLEALDAAPLLKDRGIPIATTVSWFTPAASSRPPEDRQRVYRHALANIRYLVDAGVTVAFGTDNPPPLDQTQIMTEVAALSEVLSPREIIRAMTIDAARFVDAEDRLGTLAPGKTADLIIIDGDPLTDISALADVALVIQDGTVVSDSR